MCLAYPSSERLSVNAYWPFYWLLVERRTDSGMSGLLRWLTWEARTHVREQCLRINRSLGRTAVSNLGVIKLAVERPQQVVFLGADGCLCLLQRIDGCIHLCVLVQCTALAGHDGYVADRPGMLPLDSGSSLRSAVARAPKHTCLFAILQLGRLGQIVRNGCRRSARVYQSRVSIHADVRFHDNAPLFALLGLMHLRAALAVLVFSQSARGDRWQVGGTTIDSPGTGGPIRQGPHNRRGDQRCHDSLQESTDRACVGRRAVPPLVGYPPGAAGPAAAGKQRNGAGASYGTTRCISTREARFVRIFAFELQRVPDEADLFHGSTLSPLACGARARRPSQSQ